MKAWMAMLGLVTLWTLPVWCNIPVFRYALERWKSDKTRIVVFAEELTPQQRAQLQLLEERSAKGQSNVEWVVSQPSTEKDQERLELWKREVAAPSQLPWVVVQTPFPQGKIGQTWSGRMDAITWDWILDSPSRKELAKRLLAGDSVVWLVLQSKDAQANAACRRMLKETFEKLETELELPEGIGEPGSELYSEVPLFLRFSSLEIDIEKDEERYFRQLAQGFSDQIDLLKEPILIPVFGRGRALEVIPYSRIDGPLVSDLTKFLCGACSCQVKERNPGFDLLLSVHWTRELFGEGGFVPEPKDGEKSLGNAPVLLTIPPGKK
ncbi:MAG: hypothetical protein U0905_06540 [Pirellulales bacterium]